MQHDIFQPAKKYLK